MNTISSNIASLNARNANAYKDEDTKIATQRNRQNDDVAQVAAQNKIAQIRDSIEAKEYKLDLQKTSEKMALDLLNL
ncbi:MULTISPECIES: hypothetical protein [Helicobacter]|uniref:Anti-sigma-28 factor FlgM C-terminal domain-containing protein n=1 Tax=Helicobacter macacae MIT 99-5501 TaxID=1357400 RepID=V8C6S8_9HELI|nr:MULTISPECIES: hypothetical protein [Helicobacter]ETD22740.1 hypothetical protein HMPREF2086_01539 [Helicobacter macacae MIT 99-5501]RDU53423.1 hypothetical protein CQA40_05585 [Helicobacter sp. MIT 01-3238]